MNLQVRLTVKRTKAGGVLTSARAQLPGQTSHVYGCDQFIPAEEVRHTRTLTRAVWTDIYAVLRVIEQMHEQRMKE